MTEASGASVIVPAGALAADVTIRIARDSTGAPAIPADLTPSGSMYVITPHGGEFSAGVEVRIPAPDVILQPNQQFKIAKAELGGEWVVNEDTILDQGTLSTTVDSFSFFTAVVVTYVLPIAQAVPLQVTTSLTCSDDRCGALIGPVTATYTVVGNGGQLPQNCTDPVLAIVHAPRVYYSSGNARLQIPTTGGSITVSRDPGTSLSYEFGVAKRCGGFGTWSEFGYSLKRGVHWAPWANYPSLAMVRMPGQVDVVEGHAANIDAVLSGGASELVGTEHRIPTPNDSARIDWERSDDNGASWRVVAQSNQYEANPLPGGVGIRWRYWSVSHGLVANATDQGALLRVHACYTPPAGGEPYCITSGKARLNVLQQSAQPSIVDAPRSVLVRTGQTANLSATASGAPAPTLQWQSRAANSNEPWANVTTGTGATTTNYTTAPTTLADNGVQYRVLATNAVGSAASTAVTVSVSDLDVAPSIATQPASLSVAAGSDAVFAVDARGTEALSYQWYRDGAALAGANGPVLRITDVSSLNSGNYSVRVSNSAGNADSDAAMLNVYRSSPPDVAPTIVTQPAAVTVNAGNTATFAVGVDGSGPFTFQWRKDGVNIPGSTSAVLTLPGVTAASAGSYSVVVSNAASAGVTSSSAVLTVNPNSAASAPSITTQPATLIVAPGGSGILAVAATGSGPLSYQWFHEGVPMAGETAAVLALQNIDDSFAGAYAVRVSNSLGTIDSQPVDVILLGAPVIYTSPADVSAYENSITTFRVDSAGSGRHYQWLRNGAPIASSDAETYTTPMLTVADSGAIYSVIVYNSAGLVVSAPAVLTVAALEPPTILQQPADASIQAGAVANLCMAFGGSPPFVVQMKRRIGTQWTQVGSDNFFSDNAEHCVATPALQSSDDGAQFSFFTTNATGGFFLAQTRAVTVTVAASPAITATTLASRTSSGAVPNNRSDFPSISADGTLVAFRSDGTNLVPGFTNYGHGYVRNLRTGVTTAVDQLPDGTEPLYYGVSEMKLAAGGRYVVFASLAPGLVAGDTNNSQDVFLRDLQTGTTKQLTLFPDGSELTDAGNGIGEMHLDISADGRYVIFSSRYDFTRSQDVQVPVMALFLRDTLTDQTRILVSHPTDGFGYTALAGDGGYLAYTLAHFSPDYQTISIMDLETFRSSTIFTLDRTNTEDYLHQGMSISRNGRYVAFSLHSPTVLGTAIAQVIVIDSLAPETLILASTGSVGSGIGMGNATSNFPKLSDDGRYVVYRTNSTNLTANLGSPLDWAVMLRDLQTQTTTIASRRANGTPVRSTVTAYDSHVISGDGSVVAFTASQSDMGDGNIEHQVYAAPRP